jgi:hypothetical protein
VKRTRLFGSIPLLLALGIAQVGAVEVPLSRASFERAVEEGRSCKRMEDSDAYVILKRGTEPVLAALLLRTEAPEGRITLKLKPSLLGKP